MGSHFERRDMLTEGTLYYINEWLYCLIIIEYFGRRRKLRGVESQRTRQTTLLSQIVSVRAEKESNRK